MSTAIKSICGLVLLLVFPGIDQACWQLDRTPTKLSSDRFEVNFSYQGKPLAGAFVFLRSSKADVRLQAVVDKDGWVRFPTVKSGKYKLIFDGPSYESFDVEFEHTYANDASMSVWFYADYCHSIRIHKLFSHIWD